VADAFDGPLIDAICLIDTSVFVELLGVPGMCTRREAVRDRFELLVRARARLYVSLAVVIETGNHIAQNGDGQQRRAVAAEFLRSVEGALAGTAPWKIVPLPKEDELRALLRSFADDVHRNERRGKGRSLGDAALVREFHRQCELNPARRVFIWTLDGGLEVFDRRP
jgi:hypothetical protein